MSFQANVKPYSGISVTLPLAATPYNLYELLKAIDPNCPPVCRELNIQFDPLQDNISGAMLVGDSDIAPSPAQRCGFTCLGGQSKTYGAGATLREVYMNNIWLLSTDMVNMLVNVEVQN